MAFVAFIKRPGVLRGIGGVLALVGVINMIGLPGAFMGNDLSVRGMVIDGLLFVVPGFVLMRIAEAREK